MTDSHQWEGFHSPGLHDALHYTLRDRHGPQWFKVSDMLGAAKKRGNLGNSRWVIDNEDARKKAILHFIMSGGDGDYRDFGQHSRSAFEMDMYGQLVNDYLTESPTEEYRDLVRQGVKPHPVMEHMATNMGGTGFGSWDTDPQFLPLTKPPLRALSPALKNIMENLKGKMTPPQEILDKWTDPDTIEGIMARHEGLPTERDKYWRMQGGPRDRFMRRASMEAADLLNFMDSQRRSDNRRVVSDFIDSDMEQTERSPNRWGRVERPHSRTDSRDPAGYARTPLYERYHDLGLGEGLPYRMEDDGIDEPVIWNEAFDENWQIFNRSEDPFEAAWDSIQT